MDNRELARRLKVMGKQEVGRIMTRLAEPSGLSDYAIAEYRAFPQQTS